jgi:hypothetical protein
VIVREPLRASSLALIEIDPIADRRWDAFVRAHDHASVYHLAAWARILCSTYRFKPRYLALQDRQGKLRGVLPLLHKRGPVSGARLRSLPVVPAAGPLADDEALELELLEAACRLTGRGEQLVVTSLSAGLERLDGVAVRSGLPRWIVPLGSTDPARWRSGARNPARGVGQSRAAGARVREAGSRADVRAFYRLYLLNQRRLRALPRSYRQLERARALLADDGIFRLFLVEHDGQPVAGAVWHAFGGTLEGLYYGGDERFARLRPSHALYSHALDWALEYGCTHVDLGGAAAGSSLASFKAQWEARPVPLYFYVYPAEAAPADPGAAPAPTSREISEIGWLGQLWKRLPLAVLRAGGGVAYRYL